MNIVQRFILVMVKFLASNISSKHQYNANIFAEIGKNNLIGVVWLLSAGTDVNSVSLPSYQKGSNNFTVLMQAIYFYFEDYYADPKSMAIIEYIISIPDIDINKLAGHDGKTTALSMIYSNYMNKKDLGHTIKIINMLKAKGAK